MFWNGTSSPIKVNWKLGYSMLNHQPGYDLRLKLCISLVCKHWILWKYKANKVDFYIILLKAN